MSDHPTSEGPVEKHPDPPDLIETLGQVRLDGKPFVLLLLDGKAAGQLPPSEAMAMGIRFIQSAIEAERDAATILGLRDAGFDDATSAGFLDFVRKHRGQVDPDPRSDHHPGDPS